MVARDADRVVSKDPAEAGIAATDAHVAAGITYRQLDHWARQGWVRPSIDSGEGRWAKRLYAPDDVVRLALLRHLAQSRVNASLVGPMVSQLDLPLDDDARVVWGPVGAKQPDEPVLVVLRSADALSYVARPGAYVIFDPTEVRRCLQVLRGETQLVDANVAPQPARRSA